MKTRIAVLVLVLSTAAAFARGPASVPNSAAGKAHTSDIGFSYDLPTDWEVVDTTPTLPAVQQKVKNEATSEEEKHGVDCLQLALTARHGDPASVVVVVALPFACLGEEMTDKDLPAFGGGASDGLKKNFDLVDPVRGTYSLGNHSVWIERARGNLKSRPGTQYTVETVCSVLKRGTVCWMAMAADNATLQTFEQGAVALDGEAPVALVPETAFDKKPS